MDATLQVNEIFFSLQGESSFAGRPCSFVRLTGCNLRCVWCDTEYAFHQGQRMTLDEITSAIGQHGSDLVEITGGEPLLQEGVHALISRFLDQGKTVLVETGGSLDIRSVDPRAILIYDIKCPDSGMAERNLLENLDHLRPHDEIKFVLASRDDYRWAVDMLDSHRLAQRHAVLFSPVWESLPPQDLARWILDDGLAVRMQLQLHKLLWGEKRGV